MDAPATTKNDLSYSIPDYIQKANALNSTVESDQVNALPEEATGKYPENEELLIRLVQSNNLAGKGKTAELITKRIKEKFPNSPHVLRLLGESYKAQGKYRQALKYFKLSIDEDSSNIVSFVNYANLIALLETNNTDVVIEVMERFKAAHFTDVSPFYIYSKYCLNIIHDTKRTRQILLEGLKIHPDRDLLLTLLLYVESIEGNQEEALRLQAKMDTLGIESLIHIETKIEDKALDYRNLSEFITLGRNTRPKIIDAEQYSFANEKSTVEPVIALYAYARPRPNLDVIYHLYNLLKSKGKTVLLFLRNEHLNDFDFFDIDSTADDVFYGVWPEFFYAADFINCIITNDICEINPLCLPEQTKLVFHAPHGTAMPTIYRQNLISHYSTFLNSGDLPDSDEILRFDITPENICLIPNSYTKNEYLLNFIENVKKPIRIISFCPTTFVILESVLRITADYELSLKNYLRHTIEMVQNILETFPEHYFLYRPFWGHSNHLHLTKPLLEKFRDNNHFLVDDYSNSKHTLAMSEVFITDISGLGITFSDMKQIKHIRYSSMNIITAPDDSADKDTYFACNTPAEVIAAVSAVLSNLHDVAKSGQPEKVSAELRARYGGASYLVDNIDYILEGKKNDDWYYFDVSDMPITGWDGLKNV